jgi:pSer/pThr/pTyr-binding forkhead associated (FHA) protein
MAKCSSCGNELESGARFCSQCGTPVADSPAEETSTIVVTRPGEGDEAATDEASPIDDATVAALRAGTAILVVQTGPDSGGRYLLDTEAVTAGRHADSDIFLDDITVSRRHAEFVRMPAGYVVRDVGSLNGTYVNKDRIDEIALHDADEVQIGKFRLVYRVARAGFQQP